MDVLLPPTLPLIRKLECITSHSIKEIAVLLRLPMQARHMRADQDIVQEAELDDALGSSNVQLQGETMRNP